MNGAAGVDSSGVPRNAVRASGWGLVVADWGRGEVAAHAMSVFRTLGW